MSFIIGLIVFWISILGIKRFLEDKFRVDKMFSLPLSITFIGIAMFIAGILNMMKIVVIFILLLSFTYILTQLKHKKINIKEIKKTENIIMIIIFLYITIVGFSMHLTHYDNFSHWGLIIKNMFIDDALPNFENTTIMFKGYQPGSACFIYFFGLLCGKTEGAMIIAQNYLIFAFITPLLGMIKKENKWLKRMIFISFYIFIMTISIRFSDLLVDSLLATTTITSLAIVNHYKNDLKKGFLYSLPISIFLLLIKNTGLILVGFVCLYILYIAHRNKKLKEGIKYVFITGIITVLTLLIWQNHVTLVYGNEALNAKHSLSSQNIILQLRMKGWKNIFLFIKDYALHLFNLKNNTSNIFMIIINIILLTLFVDKNKKQKKDIIELLAIVNITYLSYYVILGLMYLLSMPWDEAIIFAGYGRYMSTIIIIIVGMIYIYLFKKNIKVIGGIIILLMLIPIYFYKTNAIALIGEDYYKNSIVEKYDKIISNLKIQKERKYYIYSPSSKNDFGYLEFLSKYKLNTSEIEVIYDVESIKEEGIVIVIDENEEIKSYLNENKMIEKPKLVYTKQR